MTLTSTAFSHDINEELGGESFTKTQDWEAIDPVWKEYAMKQFSKFINFQLETLICTNEHRFSNCRRRGPMWKRVQEQENNSKAEGGVGTGRSWDAVDTRVD